MEEGKQTQIMLTPEQIFRVDCIGFQWRTKKLFDERIEASGAFVEEYSHFKESILNEYDPLQNGVPDSQKRSIVKATSLLDKYVTCTLRLTQDTVIEMYMDYLKNISNPLKTSKKRMAIAMSPLAGFEDNPSLGYWCANIRMPYHPMQLNRSGRRCSPSIHLTSKQIHCMDAIVFQLTMTSAKHFQIFCDDLVRFKAEHGHCNVPESYHNKGLVQWIQIQRKAYAMKMDISISPKVMPSKGYTCRS